MYRVFKYKSDLGTVRRIKSLLNYFVQSGFRISKDRSLTVGYWSNHFSWIGLKTGNWFWPAGLWFFKRYWIMIGFLGWVLQEILETVALLTGVNIQSTRRLHQGFRRTFKS